MFYILDVFEMVLDEMDDRVKDRRSRHFGTQTRLRDCWKTNPANLENAKKAVLKAKKCHLLKNLK